MNIPSHEAVDDQEWAAGSDYAVFALFGVSMVSVFVAAADLAVDRRPYEFSAAVAKGDPHPAVPWILGIASAVCLISLCVGVAIDWIAQRRDRPFRLEPLTNIDTLVSGRASGAGVVVDLAQRRDRR